VESGSEVSNLRIAWNLCSKIELPGAFGYGQIPL
jgi:hypothetical protein